MPLGLDTRYCLVSNALLMMMETTVSFTSLTLARIGLLTGCTWGRRDVDEVNIIRRRVVGLLGVNKIIR